MCNYVAYNRFYKLRFYTYYRHSQYNRLFTLLDVYFGNCKWEFRVWGLITVESQR